MTSKSKWILKQYWRVGAIRAIFGVVLGMFVLGRYYYPFVPFLNNLDPGILGAILLAGILLLVFLTVGFFYDAKLQLWNEAHRVSVDRNPFTYVPYYRFKMMEYPFFFSLVTTLRNIALKVGASTQNLDDLSEYLEFYFSLKPEIREHLFGTPPIAQEYMSKHPFTEKEEPSQFKQSFGKSVKYKFQLTVWRLNWVQGLTGLGQDVLVFAALYIGILFPHAVTSTGGVSFDYLLLGIVFISIPLYVSLIAFGWVYDKKLRLWSPDIAVKIERDPFSYVPDFKLTAFVYPMYYALYSILHDAQKSLKIDTKGMDVVIRFLEEYWTLVPSRDSDMARARELRSQLGNVWMEPNRSDKKDD